MTPVLSPSTTRVVEAESATLTPEDEACLRAYFNEELAMLRGQCVDGKGGGGGNGNTVEDEMIDRIDDLERMRVVRRALGNIDPQHQRTLKRAYTRSKQVSKYFVRVFGSDEVTGVAVHLVTSVDDLVSACTAIVTSASTLEQRGMVDALKLRSQAALYAARRSYLPALKLARRVRFRSQFAPLLKETPPHHCGGSEIYPCPCGGGR